MIIWYKFLVVLDRVFSDVFAFYKF